MNNDQRPADYFELYNSTGDLPTIGWFDRFGIRRMILDRSLLDGTDDLEGVPLSVEGDSYETVSRWNSAILSTHTGRRR
jgi:hypothetical protein